MDHYLTSHISNLFLMVAAKSSAITTFQALPPPPGTLHTTTLLMAPDGPRQTEQTKGEKRSGLLGQARPGQGWDGLD